MKNSIASTLLTTVSLLMIALTSLLYVRYHIFGTRSDEEILSFIGKILSDPAHMFKTIVDALLKNNY